VIADIAGVRIRINPLNSDNKNQFCPACGKPVDDGLFVTLPKPEFERLKISQKSVRLPTPGNRYKDVSNSPICLNYELVDFIFECSKSVSMTKIPAMCPEEFGADGRVSYSAVQRF